MGCANAGADVARLWDTEHNCQRATQSADCLGVDDRGGIARYEPRPRRCCCGQLNDGDVRKATLLIWTRFRLDNGRLQCRRYNATTERSGREKGLTHGNESVSWQVDVRF